MANATSYKGNEGNKGGMQGQGSHGQAGQVKEEVKGAAQSAMDTASSMASNAASAVKDAASNIGEKAKDFASGFGDRAESAFSSVGQGIQSVGDTLRERGPREGMLGSANSAIASALHEGGHYLNQEGLSGMAQDLTSMIRRNPLPALFLGVGLGFMLARMTSSRS